MSAEKRVKALVWTATVGSYNLGLLASYEENGYRIVKWFNTRTEERCNICKMMNGMQFNLTQARFLLPAHPYGSCIWVVEK